MKYKIKNTKIDAILDQQIENTIKSMFLRARDKGFFGKYAIGHKVSDDVSPEDIAKQLWPTVGLTDGKPPQNFIDAINGRLVALKAKGELQ